MQGGYAAHARMLTTLNVPWCYVRRADELATVNGLIIPGGESSTALKLLHEEGLFHAVQQAAMAGMPMFGTCAGAILLAKHVVSPAQISLDIVDVTIERNAYGRQLASRIVYGHCKLKPEPLEMMFIRAPRIIALGPGVEVIADLEGEPVCVQQNQFLIATFHPELTHDDTLHRYFVGLL